MFYGLAAEKIDTRSWRFEHVLQDIQTLNERAERGELDITAISIHQYPYVAGQYILTNCGSSMGDGYGPMVVAREPMTVDDLRGKRIAVPGLRTTAFLALSLLLSQKDEGAKGPRDEEKAGSSAVGSPAHLGPPSSLLATDEFNEPEFASPPCFASDNQHRREAEIPTRRESTIDNPVSTFRHFDVSTFPSAVPLPLRPFVPEVVMFDQILSFVEAGRADAGLIIHEGQLTYQRHKLHLVVDLGAWWKESTGLPLPLGGNVIRRDLGHDAIEEIASVLKKSIEYSLAHREQAVAHALQYARDMGKELADKFVGMYVNHWTIDYGDAGRHAVRELLRRAHAAGLAPDCGEIDFAA